MSLKPTQIAAATFMVTAVGIPLALAQTGAGDQTTTQGAAPLAVLRSGTSLSADDHYLYILGNGQITRIDKGTGMAAGQLTTTGWSAPTGSAGATGTTGGNSR
jgi:hypothetical protein